MDDDDAEEVKVNRNNLSFSPGYYFPVILPISSTRE